MNTHSSMCNEENLDGFWEIYVCIYRGDITVAVINYKSKFIVRHSWSYNSCRSVNITYIIVTKYGYIRQPSKARFVYTPSVYRVKVIVDFPHAFTNMANIKDVATFYLFEK